MLSRSFTYFKEIYFSFALLAVISLAGTVGYMFIEGYSISESLYMTIITVSTVGFQEVRPLTEAGRYFTVILILTSFGTFAYAASSIAANLLTGQYRRYVRHFRVNKQIDQLTGHVIVCGYGRNGHQAVRTLRAYGQDFVVIEQDEKVIEELRLEGALFVHGDATSEDILVSSGIDRATALITTLPKDSDNVFTVLTAREISRKLSIISRASEESTQRKLKIAGANNVIMPERVGGTHMASMVMVPDVHEFLNSISVIGGSEVNLEEIHFKYIPTEYHNRELKDIELIHKMGCLIIGYKTPDGEYIVNPSGDRKIQPESKLFILGKPSQIQELNAIFNIAPAH